MISSAELQSAGIDTSLDGRIATFHYLRFLLQQKPIPLRQCLTLVRDLDLDAQTEKRCKALIHALDEGQAGSRSSLGGLLNKHEDALRARLRGQTLRQNDKAMPQKFHGKVPNIDAKTFRSDPGRKSGSHRR